MANLGKGFYYSLAGAFLWAASIILLRFILNSGESVFSVMFWNVIIGFPFWLAIFLKNIREIKKLTRKDYLILAGIVLVSSVTQTLVDMLAVKYSPAINYSFLMRTVVIFTFIFAYILLKEKLSKGKIIIAATILFGAYLLTADGQSISFTTGDLITILDAALIAFGNSILGKMATNRMKPMFVVSATAMGAFLPEAGLAFYLGGGVPVVNFLLIISLTLLYLVLNSVRFITYKYVSASFVTVMMSLTPFFVTIMAIPLLGESITAIQLAGGLLIVGASVLAVRNKI